MYYFHLQLGSRVFDQHGIQAYSIILFAIRYVVPQSELDLLSL